MPRQKLSEYRAKCLVYQSLGLDYQGWSIDTENPISTQVEAVNAADTSFVVKVDEGVKGRFKKGLVLLDVAKGELSAAITELSDKGYHSLIVEPQVAHDQAAERYLSMASDRDGILMQYTDKGGVDIEQHAESIQQVRLNETTDWDQLAAQTGLKSSYLHALEEVFTKNYFVFLEINPYIVSGDTVSILDAAVEVDDAAAFFVDNWQPADFRRYTGHSTNPKEVAVQELNANSPASFSLSVLNPDGGIFLLLSGGGASVVVADEVYNRGLGESLANYGEYSGNPNTEETYLYTKIVLELLLASQVPRKVLFIGGAVANFTDIAKTFAGVIQAINEVADDLREQNVKIYVRRGGPNQAVGLERLRKALDRNGLLGAVHDPSTPLTVAVGEAVGGFV